MTLTTDPRPADWTPPPGHNNPPTPAQIVTADLDREFADFRRRRDDLTAAAKDLPAAAEGLHDAHKLADGAAAIKAFLTKADEARKAVKAPRIEEGKAIDAWFDAVTADLLTTVDRLTQAVNAYQRSIAGGDKKAGQLRTDNNVVCSLTERAVLHLDNPAVLPREYLKPDETKIKAALAAGTHVRGASLQTTLTTTIR